MIRQIERNVGDLVNLQGKGFEFRGTAVKVEEQAQITKRKFFPKLQDSIHWIICFGDITWSPADLKKGEEEGKDKGDKGDKGDKEGDETDHEQADPDSGDDVNAHNQSRHELFHPHLHSHSHHHHGSGSGASGHQLQTVAHHPENENDEEHHQEEGQQEEGDVDAEVDAEVENPDENEENSTGFQMLVTNGSDGSDDDFEIRVGASRPPDSKRKKRKTAEH